MISENKKPSLTPAVFHILLALSSGELHGYGIIKQVEGDSQGKVNMGAGTLYGLGAGVWTRDAHQLYQVPRAIKAGRVWVNCYHNYPAHAPFGGYKKSGFGRENHKMMLDHYRNNKNMLISYDKKAMGFF